MVSEVREESEGPGLPRYSEGSKRTHRRSFLGYLLLFAIIGLGLYQTGYTGVEWEAIKSAAQSHQQPVTHQIEERDGLLGFVRLVWMTNSDERLYGEYARLTLTGQADLEYIAAKQYAHSLPLTTTSPLRPYRDVRVEYPPVALLGMILPGLVSLDPWGYRFALGVLNLLLLGLCGLLVAKLPMLSADRETVTFRLMLMVLLLGIVTVTRIDLVATALMLGAMLACCRQRPAWGGLLTGLGIMAKLFPGLWGLVYCLGLLRQRRFRSLMVFALSTLVVVTAINVGMWWLAGDGYVDTYLYHSQRGIQIESTWASLLLPLHLLFDVNLTLDLSFGSSNIHNGATQVMASWWPLVFLALAAPFAIIGWKKRLTAQPWILLSGCLLSLVIANKVLSPQYLLWLFPFFLLEGGDSGKRRAVLFLMACLLSQVLYPRGYDLLKAFHPVAVGVLLVRNGLLLWLWWETLKTILNMPTAVGGLIEAESRQRH